MENLTTKYRPRCLKDLMGQPAVVHTLSHFVAQPYPVAMLFHGDTGTGKTSTAYALGHELGCAVDDAEMGGVYEIPSGEMSADEVRAMLRQLCFRPLLGSGWRVLICNEADRMSRPAETIWLDGLEHLPPHSVVIFTTNSPQKLSQRFRDRCETYHFESASQKIQPAIQALATKVWQAEVGHGDCPALDVLGMPTMGDLDNMHASFRLALNQLQRYVREAKTAVQVG